MSNLKDNNLEMNELHDVLNLHLGLKTKFCHNKDKIKVIFDEQVTDEMIYNLAEQSGQAHLQINFYKWVRGYPVMSNWILELDVTFNDPKYRQIHLENVIECLRGCKAMTGGVK